MTSQPLRATLPFPRRLSGGFRDKYSRAWSSADVATSLPTLSNSQALSHLSLLSCHIGTVQAPLPQRGVPTGCSAPRSSAGPTPTHWAAADSPHHEVLSSRGSMAKSVDTGPIAPLPLGCTVITFRGHPPLPRQPYADAPGGVLVKMPAVSQG